MTLRSIIRKSLMTMTAAAAITAATISSGKAQSNIEYLQTPTQEDSRIRPNLFYGFPKDIKGYTFVEFYGDGKSYFAKTGVTKEIYKGLSARVESVNGSAFTDQAGLGAQYALPFGENTDASIKLMPIFMDYEGKHVENKAIFGYAISSKLYVPIVKDLKIVAFGEINLAAKDGPAYGYGEVHLKKDLGALTLGIGADMHGDGDLTPQVNVNASIAYTFGK